MKYLLTLLVLVIGVKWWLARSRAEQAARRPRPPAPPAPGQGPQPMLACAHCGLVLPASEVLRDAEGHPFCGSEHRRLGLRPDQP